MTQLGSQSSTAVQLPDTIDGVPNVSGAEGAVGEAMRASEWPPQSGVHDGGDPFAGIGSACAIALHMHQPLIPAGGEDLRTAPLISNLQYMFEHPDIGDNHNAAVFRWCYRRMGEFVPESVDAGLQPRVMLGYSGTLLHGLRLMGADDVLDALRAITVDARYRGAVEWLGCPWGHPGGAVDSGAGLRAARACMAAALCGSVRTGGIGAGTWLLAVGDGAAQPPGCGVRVRAHARGVPATAGCSCRSTRSSIPDGQGPQHPHLPHVLSCSSSSGESASILALVKTQGSDTKLVAQMQPYYEARTLDRAMLGGRSVPQLVTQIADGENGGVMINEFPSKYRDVVGESSGSETPMLNGTEYLERVFASGVREPELPVIQPRFEHRIGTGWRPATGPSASLA